VLGCDAEWDAAASAVSEQVLTQNGTCHIPISTDIASWVGTHVWDDFNARRERLRESQ